MPKTNLTRRQLIKSAAATAGATAFAAHGLNAWAQDAALDTPRAANHLGYEKVQWKAQPFPMPKVRLLYGPFKEMQERNRVYLYMLPNDRLLHSFRLTAGKPSTAEPLGGWEAPDCELRGHLAGGHYLSACALMYASTGDDSIRLKAEELVWELSQLQQRNGYLGAYPESYYDRLKKHEHVWAPFYTYHKILAGHLDMYVHCGSGQALETAEKMANWAIDWIAPLTDEELAKVQVVEHGGMNEVLFNLYAVTGKQKYLDAGQRFEHKRFFAPLEAHEDKLEGLHSNTNIPKVVGAARGYELTGSERYRSISEFFFHTVVDHHTFAPGGTCNTIPNEGWSGPDTLSSHLGPGGQECCCSYNMLKLSRHLFGWNLDSAYMDYYERLLWNVRLGTQDERGMLMYYIPTVPGGWKTFGSQFASNWCCTGTGSEEYAKLADTLYFHDASSIYVNQFIASQVQWEQKGVTLTQHANFPEEESTALHIHAEHPVNFTLRIRNPRWCDKLAIHINGKPEKPTDDANGYLSLTRTWQPGDRVDVALPMKLRTLPDAENPAIQAVAYGPLVLAAQLGRDGLSRDMIDNNQGPDTDRLPALPLPEIATGKESFWVERTNDDSLQFRTVGQSKTTRLKPLNQILDERVSVYWKVQQA